ncbi:hypothetical protein NQ314_008839 [Rhamnusium bicolor]|uniref:DDE Tnp4 domain-containing protein n=1 Tax=Rhamnusium bicolor TaxID=1586634 RepID=A0AAV8Y6M8_9CUCU|nr:hypothetical protein NQ314_008839 [Rhamnusium bicolor]
MCKKRMEYGEFHTLFPDLVEDEVKFFQYFHMSHEKFQTLLDILTPDLTRENTTFRVAIGPKERLAICLRNVSSTDAAEGCSTCLLPLRRFASIGVETREVEGADILDKFSENPTLRSPSSRSVFTSSSSSDSVRRLVGEEMFEYLATGNSFRSLAFNYRLGERSVREIVYSCCDAIWRKLQPIVMPTPDEAMWLKIEHDFYTKWNFPNLIGAIDVDANYKFIAIDVGAYGKNSDGGIFKNSNLGRGLNNNTLHIPPAKQLPGSNEILPFVIVGDEAFPLRTNLMKPYSRDIVRGNEEKKSGKFVSSIPSYDIEEVFGGCDGILWDLTLASCLPWVYSGYMKKHKETKNSACILHNFVRLRDGYKFEDTLACDMGDIAIIGTGGTSNKATDIRNSFASFFVSPAGSVPWQYDII